jgi:hypothetical protein
VDLTNYVSKQPTGGLLKEGTHVVNLAGVVECTSFDTISNLKVSGQKADLPAWINPIDVLAILAVNKNGSIFHRIHLGGAKRFNELTDKELQTGSYEEVQGFACKKTKLGLVRVEDEDRTSACMNILDHFIWSLGEPAGTPALTCIERAIANKTQFQITVIREPWETGDQYRISKFTRIEGAVDADEVPAELEA